MQRGESHQMKQKTEISDIISAFSLPAPHSRVIVKAPWLKGGALLPTHDQRHTHDDNTYVVGCSSFLSLKGSKLPLASQGM
jgi:hypothetical protein